MFLCYIPLKAESTVIAVITDTARPLSAAFGLGSFCLALQGNEEGYEAWGLALGNFVTDSRQVLLSWGSFLILAVKSVE